MEASEGSTIVSGRASGEVLHAAVGLSFWGGVDPNTGVVIDHHHPLCGKCLSGKVLALPSGRGSCTGSQVLLELLLNGMAPAAILLQQVDEIIALGAVLAEELFGKSLPIVCVGTDTFSRLSTASHASVDGARVLFSTAAPSSPSLNAAPVPPSCSTVGREQPGSKKVSLTAEDRAMLSGDRGQAVAVAMRILERMAAIQGASELLDVSQAHIDACTYIGPASLRVAQRFLELGGRVEVPTTLNAISVDQQRWRQQGVPATLGLPANALAEAYLAMGARPSFTCAPYHLDTAPKFGEQVAWSESNAVTFANSVLGARTQKYPDFLDVCMALTGRAPRAGCHLDGPRRARLVIRLQEPPLLDDAFWPTLGYLCGLRAEAAVPAVVGLERTRPSLDDLKAFSAALATTSSAAMFHIVGVTPEAPTLATALGDKQSVPEVVLGRDDLASAWASLDGHLRVGAVENLAVDLVSLGNPHFSIQQCADLAKLCSGRVKDPHVNVVVTVGRQTSLDVQARGIATQLRGFGVQLVSDTCWCMLGEPVVPKSARTLITNSAKYAHYAPGLVGRRVRFSNLAGCVDAACTGRAPRERPGWLAEGPAVLHSVKGAFGGGARGFSSSVPTAHRVGSRVSAWASLRLASAVRHLR